MEASPRTAPWRGATFCCTLEVLGLAIWVGGLVAILGSVIPEVFNLGMEAGGRLLTKVFVRYNQLILLAIGLIVTVGIYRVWLVIRHGAAEASFSRWEGSLLAIMILIQLVLMVVLVPESVVRQEAAFAAQGEVARKAAHDAFFQSHKVVRSLYVANFVFGAGVIAVKIRQWLGIGRNWS